MRLRPMAGRGSWWIRQPADTFEASIPTILDTMQNYGGGTCFTPKVADGLNFQGINDATFACNSIADIVALRDLCWARGLGFTPVVMPRGLLGEAEFHGTIAQACGNLMVDIEPGTGFWDKTGYALIPVYWQYLRKAAGDAYLIAQPDPRVSAWNAVQMDASLPYIDAICGQHYVGWLGVGWTNVTAEVDRFTAIASHGKEMYVTLYAGDPQFPQPNDYAKQFWDRVGPRCLGWNAFALGPSNGLQLELIGTLQTFAVAPDPIKPEPPAPAKPAVQITGPIDGSILTGTAVQVVWAAQNASLIQVYAGTRTNPNQYDLTPGLDPSVTSATLHGLPYDGSEVVIAVHAYSLDQTLEVVSQVVCTAQSPQPQPQPHPQPQPNPPADEWAFRTLVSQLSAANAADLLDRDQTLPDMLPTVEASVTAITTAINERKAQA